MYAVCAVPKTIPGFSVSGLSLVTLTAKTDQSRKIGSKSSKRKGTLGGVLRKPSPSSQETLPSGGTQDKLNSSSIDCVVYQASSLGMQCPGFLPGAGHIDILCLACNRIPAFQRDTGFSRNHIACTV